jgi:hypothetical protein
MPLDCLLEFDKSDHAGEHFENEILFVGQLEIPQRDRILDQPAILPPRGLPDRRKISPHF